MINKVILNNMAALLQLASRNADRRLKLRQLREIPGDEPTKTAAAAVRAAALDGVAEGKLTIVSLAHEAIIFAAQNKAETEGKLEDKLEEAGNRIEEISNRLAAANQALQEAQAQLQQRPAVDPETAKQLAECQKNLAAAQAKEKALQELLDYHNNAPYLERLAEQTFDVIGHFLSDIAASSEDPNTLSLRLKNYNFQNMLVDIPVLGPAVWQVVSEIFKIYSLPPQELAIKLKMDIAAFLVIHFSERNSEIDKAALDAFQATATSAPQPTQVKVPAPVPAPAPDLRTTEEKLRTIQRSDKKAVEALFTDFPSIVAFLTHPDRTIFLTAKYLTGIYLKNTTLPSAAQTTNMFGSVASFVHFIGCDQGRNPKILSVISDVLAFIAIDPTTAVDIRTTAEAFNQELIGFISGGQ